jgi:hypothetical protein
VSILSPLLDRAALVLALLVSPVAAAPPVRQAPNPAAPPVNQLVIGPAALLTAFRSGNVHWQRAADAMPGADDKERLRHIIRTRGNIRSAHLPGRARWSRDGVSVADLCDIANELTSGLYLPRLDHEVLFAAPGERPDQLLSRVHRRFEGSLAKGFPPVLSVRRFALRKTTGGAAEWTLVEGHFVTVSAMPRKLGRGGDGFAVSYIDPWGGKRAEGFIRIPQQPLLVPAGAPPVCLEAVFPEASVGKRLLKRGEPTALVVAAVISRG